MAGQWASRAGANPVFGWSFAHDSTQLHLGAGPLLIKMAKYKGGPRGQWKASVLLSLSKTSTQTRPQHTLQLHGTDSINYDSFLHPSPLPPGTDPHLRGLRSRRRQNCGWRHCACGTYTLVAWPSLCDHKWQCLLITSTFLSF